MSKSWHYSADRDLPKALKTVFKACPPPPDKQHTRRAERGSQTQVFCQIRGFVTGKPEVDRNRNHPLLILRSAISTPSHTTRVVFGSDIEIFLRNGKHRHLAFPFLSAPDPSRRTCSGAQKPRYGVLPGVARKSPIDTPTAIVDGSRSEQTDAPKHKKRLGIALSAPRRPYRTARFGLRIRRSQVRVLPSTTITITQRGLVSVHEGQGEWKKGKVPQNRIFGELPDLDSNQD
jgi:hypothetical protein